VSTFLIHAAEDAAAGEAVRGWLEAAGLIAALPGSPAEGGAPTDATLQALGLARSAVVLLSDAAEASDPVRRLLLYALNNGRTVIPVRLGALAEGGLMRLIAEGDGAIDARPGLTDAHRASIVAAAQQASSAGRVIAMLNIKGGVGKTVLAANLFAAAHMLKRLSIAFIDLDPQHNLTQYFLSATERNRRREANETLYSVFSTRGPSAIDKADFAKLPAPLNRNKSANAPRLDLILGDERLFEFTIDVASPREKDEAFARFLALAAMLRARYDAVVIDTNPCATFLTRCAIGAADHIVAPVRPDKYSLTGLNLLESVTRALRQRPLLAREFTVVLNGVGERRIGVDVDGQTRAEIAEAPFFGQSLLPIAVPFSTVLRAPPADRYAANPINTTAIMRFSQRGLKETLTAAAAGILMRAQAEAPAGVPEPKADAPLVPQNA
jgi:chromosome partitioning protein